MGPHQAPLIWSDSVITNQNGINKTLTSDIFGNIVRVYEFNGNETYITGYDYDTLGRKIAMSDPDMGNWSYEYDLHYRLKTRL